MYSLHSIKIDGIIFAIYELINRIDHKKGKTCAGSACLTASLAQAGYLNRDLHELSQS
jgi:hypothetical protein